MENYRVYSGELYHHGIKGMKWGVRRYQNPDGTWTKEGLIRRKHTEADKKLKSSKSYKDSVKRIVDYEFKDKKSIKNMQETFGIKSKEELARRLYLNNDPETYKDSDGSKITTYDFLVDGSGLDDNSDGWINQLYWIVDYNEDKKKVEHFTATWI